MYAWVRLRLELRPGTCKLGSIIIVKQNPHIQVAILLRFLYFYFCVKVFAESLLCSGQKTNISLASQLLTLSRGSHRRQPPTQRLPASSFNYRLSYEVSCELVLNATREYFNSAASLMDEDMDLARFVYTWLSYVVCLVGAHVYDCS